ncbi:helix-turn-helix transcriptional regulator [Aquimarina rhabdastrellae]
MFKKIGKNIKVLRNEGNITQSELAEKLGITRQQVANYESGRVTIPLKGMVDMSTIFDVSIDDLIKNDFFKDFKDKNERETQENAHTTSIQELINKSITQKLKPFEDILNKVLIKLEIKDLKEELTEELRKVNLEIRKEQLKN